MNGPFTDRVLITDQDLIGSGSITEHVFLLKIFAKDVFTPKPKKNCAPTNYSMSFLFVTEVTSAFKHEAVLSKGTAIEGTKVNPMDQMARDTAQQSMDTLRQSRKWCWKPTWDLPPKSP